MLNPIEHYQLAGQLYENAAREVEFRAIINRAYYAAFLSARDFAKITNSGGSVHQETLNYYKKRPHVAIYNHLNQLRGLRTTSDYQLNAIISKRDAAKSLKLAQHILKTLNYLP